MNMSLDTPEGDKIIFSNPNSGYVLDQESCEKYLKVNEEYTVDFIDIGSWSSEVYLKEIPNKSFNTVMFENLSDPFFNEIEWSEEKEPNNEVSYNHVIGQTPLGEFLITWKGWKEYAGFDIEKTPFKSDECGYLDSFSNLDSAKKLAAKHYYEKLYECMK